MKKHSAIFAYWLQTGLMLLALLFLSACELTLPDFGPATATLAPTQDLNRIETSIVQTVNVRLTIAALETQISLRSTAQPTAALPTFVTVTPRPSTATSTVVPTQMASATPLQSTFTATSTIPCNLATFVDDITYPDGATVAPEQAFTKTWRLKNSGSCTWTSYELVFASGSKMGGPDAVPISGSIQPGEMIDVSVKLVAPQATGSYTGYWQLRSASGVLFGTGTQARPFWVKVNVATATLTDDKLINVFCSAVWKAGSNVISCPSPSADFKNGAVFRVDKPKLEGGYTDDEPALVMVPPNGSDGKISGRFPTYKVQSGDHFVSLIGCMDSTPKCTVTFKLSYTTDGVNFTDLQTWDKTNTGTLVRVDIALTSLVGQNVQFVLTVFNKDGSSEDDQAFWLNPQIGD